jgi:hypothetical protein
MSTIVNRAAKNAPLTNDEVDANFSNLNADKMENINTLPTVSAPDSSDLIALYDVSGTTTGSATIASVLPAPTDTTSVAVAMAIALG